MFTSEERAIVTAREANAAISKILADMLIYDGRVNVELMERSQVEYAIHLLREYKARMSEISPNINAAA